MTAQPWLLLTIAALLWYSSVTIYVAIRGFTDIRGMLARLKERQSLPDQTQETRS